MQETEEVKEAEVLKAEEAEEEAPATKTVMEKFTAFSGVFTNLFPLWTLSVAMLLALIAREALRSVNALGDRGVLGLLHCGVGQIRINVIAEVQDARSLPTRQVAEKVQIAVNVKLSLV